MAASGDPAMRINSSLQASGSDNDNPQAAMTANPQMQASKAQIAA